MQTLPVYFHKTVPGVAHAGEVKAVAASYAKNVLIPQGLAAIATPGVRAKAAHSATKMQQEQEKRRADAAEQHQALRDASITVSAKANADGTLYAALPAEAIVRELKSSRNIMVPATAITIQEPIKKYGTYEVSVRVGDASVPLRVIVHQS